MNAPLPTHPAHEAPVDLLAAVPITLFTKSGVLRLADGRLSFTRSRNRVVLDAPMSEIHSVSKSAFGITVWHGAKRYRFAIGQSTSVAAHSDNVLIAAAALPGAISEYREARQDAAEWEALLAPLAGPAPSGLTIKQPWPTWKIFTAVVGVAVVLISAITIGVVLAN